jgi:hypothetical protein
MILILLSQQLIFQKTQLKYPPGTSDSFRIDEWPWGALGDRLGSRRSRDGIIFNLPGAPLRLSNKNNVVAKFIFSKDDQPTLECSISEIMAEHRLGPQIYGCYRTVFNMNLWVEEMKKIPNILKQGKLNLFQNWANTPIQHKGFNRLYIIVMENLFYNPNRGVIQGATIYDILDKRLNWPIPYRQLRDKMNKMHELGIVHGDMHGDNVVIQKIDSLNGIKYGIRIIDFGASLHVPGRLHSNANANRVLRSLPGAYDGINGPGKNSELTRREYVTDSQRMPRLRDSQAWARIVAMEGRLQMNKNPGSAHANYSRNRRARNEIAKEIAARYNTEQGQVLNMNEFENFLRNRSQKLPNYESPTQSQKARNARLNAAEKSRIAKLIPLLYPTSEEMRRSP